MLYDVITHACFVFITNSVMFPVFVLKLTPATSFKGALCRILGFNDSTLIQPHIHGRIHEAPPPRIYSVPQCSSMSLSSSHSTHVVMTKFAINTQDTWSPLVRILLSLFLFVLWTGSVLSFSHVFFNSCAFLYLSDVSPTLCMFSLFVFSYFLLFIYGRLDI